MSSRYRVAVLALSLLAIELIAGIQTYVLNLIAPQVAADLRAEAYFGMISTTAVSATLITIPLGPWALQKWKASTILLVGTMFTILGGLLSALATGAFIFALGRCLGGLAGGILAAVSLATIVTQMNQKWRQLVLAGYSAMWVVSSLVGPVYARIVSHFWSWRLALVVYLPLLLLARWMVARHLEEEQPGQEATAEPVVKTVMLSLTLFAGVIALALAPGLRQLTIVLIVLASALIVTAVVRLLPPGVFTAKPGRPTALFIFFMITGCYLGADAIIAASIHERIDDSGSTAAWVLTLSGLSWALTGIFTGARPAQGRGYQVRAGWGISFMFLGLAGTGMVLLTGPGWAGWALIVLSLLAGTGMGLTYLDTMNIIFATDSCHDNLSEQDLSAALVLSESIGQTTVTALCSVAFSLAVTSGNTQWLSLIYWLLALVLLAILPLLQRVQDSSR